ncbi:FAR1-related sequence 5 [Prunus dulcis]|uniref:FAR1-related sequence 5 n=1 Tax=Prunus dulcis TaxID=3755 RepID=A0A4Y1QX13_PRUDU|nr:FAR1-related sequence 5 [Prunus dulcis]
MSMLQYFEEHTQAHTASVLMDHEDDEFHATYSNDGKEFVDCMHLDSDSESLDLLDHNEQIEELTKKFGDSTTLGMSFDNEQEAYQYYNSYARSVGFSVRKLRVNKDKNGISIEKRQLQRRKESKEDSDFTFLRSQRTIEPSQAGFINQMHHAGLKPSRIFSYMTIEAGGPQHLNFIQADCNNLIMRKRTEFQKREFESSWEALLDDYGLRGNSWLEGIYALRDKWAQVYGRDHFCAGMTTTQRSESINAFLKMFFFSQNLLLREFVVQYDKAVADRREKERQAETATKQKWRNLSSNWNVEIEATTKYTSKLFYCFQDECKKLLGLRLKLQSDDGLTRRCMVMNSGMRGMSRSLAYDLSNQTRWSKEATCDVDFDSNEEVPLSTLESSSMVQYSELSHILEAKLEKHPYFRDEHDEILDKHVSEDEDNLKLRDPKIQKSKGRGKGRIKSSLESMPSKKKGSSKRKGKHLTKT